MSGYFWRQRKSNLKNRPANDPVNRAADYQVLELRQLLAADVLAISSDNVWYQLDQDIAVVSVGRNLIKAQSFGLYDLQENAFFNSVANAPLEFTPGFEANLAVLTIPTPDGGFDRFAITESPIMAAELAAEFPNIKTYRGQGIDQPAATVRLDYTDHGFHAQVLSPDGQYNVDPYFHLQTDLYMSYYSSDLFLNLDNANYSESVYSDTGDLLYGHLKHDLDGDPGEDDHDDEQAFASRASVGDIPDDNVSPGTTTPQTPPPPTPPLGFAPDFGTQLRTYETAVAATGEYTQFWGGSVSQGQSAVVTAVNRVTGIYENDVAARLQLVGNNSSIIYTNPNTDPYTNNNGFAMLGQNQSNLDSVIGNANYDIGHVFSTGGGGVALLGVIGQTGAKAQGVTGLPSPVGDSFYVDFVAHEMGHQFGGNHSFNGDSGNCAGGNRNGSTAYEPGSGSTIQGYAGICGNDNLQNNSDAMFHSISIDEIRTEITTGTGNSSATITNTGNTVPVVNAGSNFVIPDQTPFELTATGSDADGNNSLTYSWEERDLGPQRDVNAPDNGSSPIFRTWLPTTDSTRVFPRMSNVLNGTTVRGEQYPTTNWTSMDFRVVLRDNASGGGGVVSDNMSVRVVNAGTGFDITSQATTTSWTGLDSETITWNVSGTSSGLINTTNVDIFFSLDGFNYDIIVATGVPNDGSHTIEVPNVDTSAGRIKVKGAGNVFFDVNRANITVESIDPIPVIPGIDFGPVGSDVYQDFAAVSDDAYDPGVGYGWLGVSGLTTVLENRGNALIRDKVSIRTGTFLIDINNGTYNIGVVLGVVKKTDVIEIGVQGQFDRFTPQQGPNVVRSFVAVVTDSQLFIDLDGTPGLDNKMRISGITISEAFSRPGSGDGVSGNKTSLTPYTPPANVFDTASAEVEDGNSLAKFVAQSDLNFANRPILQYGKGPLARVVDGSQLATLAGAILNEQAIEIELDGLDSVIVDQRTLKELETVPDFELI